MELETGMNIGNAQYPWRSLKRYEIAFVAYKE